MVKHDAELALQNSVRVLCLLLLSKLHRIFAFLAALALEAMLPRGVVALIQSSVWTKDGFAKTTGDFCKWTSVTCHI